LFSPSGQILANLADLFRALPAKDAASAPQYQERAYKQNVPCSIQPTDVELLIDDQNRITELQRYDVIFSQNPGLRPNDMIHYVDVLGMTRTIFVRATKDEGGRGVCFTIKAIERL
jgi:Tfp pilus assembly protein PilV